MNNNEIIFFAIVIIAYILCAFTLDVPTFVHIIFGTGILALLLITMALKYKPKFENEKTSKIFQIILIIIFVLYVMAMISELWFAKRFILDSGILLVALVMAMVLNWFFKKS